METSDLYDSLAALIRASKHCAAFTGAGISTLAGIQDFRGKNGLYKQPDTHRMFDIQVFYDDPTVYYRQAKEFIYGLDEKQPAIVHTVLAQLEQKGILHAVITQNIDLLHQKAGSRRVYEIHGSPSVHRCLHCDYAQDFETTARTVKQDALPRCPVCGQALKPDITFFGEALPAKAWAAAEAACRTADVLLVLGSSLTVYPAAALPEYTLRGGGKIVIVNDQPTPLDGFAAYRFFDLEKTSAALQERFV